MPETPTFGRYAEIPYDQMTPEQQEAYRFAVETRGPLGGPNKIWVHNPKLAKVAAPFGGHFQPGNYSLSEREREIAVIIINSKWRSAYPTAAHERRGKEVGLPAATVEALLSGLPAAFTDEREQVVYEMAVCLSNSRWVSKGLYDRAVAALGHVGVTDAITLMGHYTSVSMTLAFYDVPAGAPGMVRGREGLAMTARELRPLGETLGTEALGVDLSQPLDDETFAWIEDAFAQHPVLVFRDQNLGPGELAVFGRRFGRPKIHSLVDYRHAEFPEVSWLTNVDKDGNIDWFGVKRATDWHTDSPYEEVPPRLAILHAKEVPSDKGGTMFADMRAAYDGLDAAMKARLADLVGLHGRHDGPYGVRLYEGDPEQTLDRVYTEKARPAVIRHAVTGRPILFVNPLHTHGFAGMAKDEAWQLIEELAEHSTQARFVYYHSWRVGDVLMWDEQATMHRGAGDYRPEERRIMLRTIVYPN